MFTPLDSTNDGIHDKDDNHPLVADVDPKELISIVKFDLTKCNAPGHGTITHQLLRLAIETPFYIHLVCLWSLAEFRHNKIVQSPHENYFNVCRQHKEKWDLVKMTIIQTGW